MADVSKPDTCFKYIIKRIEEILDAHVECLTTDGTSEAGCVIYGDLEQLVNDYHDSIKESRKPRPVRPVTGPVAA